MLKITIADEKGGSGKTTLAMNLAAAFCHAEHPTAVIDLDPAGHALKWAGRRHTGGPTVPPVFGGTPTNLGADLERLSFERVVIDTPGSLGAELVASIEVSDLIVVPLQPSAIDLDALGDTVALIERRKQRHADTLFVLWRASNQRSRAARDIRDVLTLQPGTLIEPYSSSLEDWQLSSRFGGTVFDMPEKSPARPEIDAISGAIEAWIAGPLALEIVNR